MLKIGTLLLSTALLLAGCGKEPATEIGYGAFQEGVYQNDYFGMTIRVPESWIVQSQAAQKEMMDSGSTLLAGDDANFKAVLKASEQQTVNLFTFFKFEQGAPVPFNPSIISVAERTAHLPGIKRGADYLHHVKQVFEAGQLAYEFPHQARDATISGVSFDILPAQIRVGNVTVYQDYYAAKIRDYVLSFVLSYGSDTERRELEAILAELEFSR